MFKFHPLHKLILVFLLLNSIATFSLAENRHKYPKTKINEVKESLHGTELSDPYRWLEEQNSSETRTWIKQQQEFANSYLSTLPGRAELKEKIAAFLKLDSTAIPQRKAGNYFFFKRLSQQDQPVLYMRKGLSGKDDVLLDPNTAFQDKTSSYSLLDISEDAELIAYGTRRGGKDEVSVNLLDTTTKKPLTDELPTGRYQGISITPDKKGIYYSRHDKEGPRVFFHAIGKSASEDKVIFGNGYGVEKIIFNSLSDDGRYLLISVLYGSSSNKTELYFQDLTKQTPITPLVNDLEARFSARIIGEEAFILTNWNAPNNRIVAVNLNRPARENWREVVPTSDLVIDNVSYVGGKIFVRYLQNVNARVKVYEPTGKFLRDIEFPSLGSVSGFVGDWNSEEAFFEFNSFHIPPTIYRYDTSKATQEVWYRSQAPINSEDYELKQVFYPSKDGTKVPMFILHSKKIKLDGSNPTLLTGYGGFNVNQVPNFSTRAAVWVKNGGVFVVANLRGGGEFGEKWHKDGMLDRKQNVFDDFISAAEWLIKNSYTSSSKLAIAGRSNGGLLVGAALTQRPDLFQAVICGFPLLDMVRYHKFLVAKFWVPEYGSSENPEQFKYLRAYSPYHNVKTGTKYPAVMFVTGDSDTRVDPLHARKMAALLQTATGSDRPILLHYDTEAGHTSELPVSKQIEDLTDELLFLSSQLGIKN